jgi:hypothetical protein
MLEENSPVQGWNDCPPMMISSNNSSTSLNKGRKKYQRVVSLSSIVRDITPVGNITLAPPGRDITPVGNSLPMTPPPFHQQSSKSVESEIDSPLISFLNSPRRSQQNSTDSLSISSGVSSADLSTKCISILDDIYTKPSRVPEKEMLHFKAKITNNLPKELNHLQFLYSTLTKLGSSTGGIDKEILNYMVVNSGVSSWCMPLKKVVSGMKY